MTESVNKEEAGKRVLPRKVRTGTVASAKMEKSITVVVKRRQQHPLYHKTVSTTNKFMAHDEKNEAQEGDLVEIIETRPLSRHKRWRLSKVIKKHQ